MKKILILVFFGIAILSCSEDNNENENNCDFETIISPEQYENSNSDQLVVNSLEINGNCLRINFSSSGCDGNTWVLKLIDSGAILESNPAQRNLKFTLSNQEACLAFITKELTFDISNLKIDGNSVILNFSNTGESVLYKY